MRRLLFVLSMAATTVCLANWKDKPFPNWNEETVFRLLTDSPWARPRTVKLTWQKKNEAPLTYRDVPGADKGNPLPQNVGSPVGGIGARPKEELPDRADIVVRWSSALPLRQARALFRQRDEKLGPNEVNRLIGVPGDYVLEVFGVPSLVAHLGTGSVEAVVKRGAYLRTKSGRTIRPSRVETTLDGLSLSIQVYFPKSFAITPADQEIECFADVQIFEFKEKFKLSSMTYQGHLEL